MKNNFYQIYILECNNGSLYTGITNNLFKGLQSHLNGKASKYTRSFKPVRLLMVSPTMHKSMALKSEHAIKHHCKTRESKAIYMNTLWREYIWVQNKLGMDHI